MMSELSFQDFCVVFYGSNHFYDPLLFEAYIRPPHCKTATLNLKLSLLRALLSSVVFSLLESALCLWIQVHLLWIQGLTRLVLWIQILTLIEDQGLWIHVHVLLSSLVIDLFGVEFWN